MNKLLAIIVISVSIIGVGCTKAKSHCYRCVDLAQVDKAFDVCNNDTSIAGRNAYAMLAAGHAVNNTNGSPDSCQAYDK